MDNPSRLERVVARQILEDELRQLRSLERAYSARADAGEETAAPILRAVREMIAEREP